MLSQLFDFIRIALRLRQGEALHPAASTTMCFYRTADKTKKLLLLSVMLSRLFEKKRGLVVSCDELVEVLDPEFAGNLDFFV